MATILSTMQHDVLWCRSSTVQSVLSIVGNYVRTALQQKRSTDGNQEAQAVVNQYSGTYPNPKAFTTSFSNQEKQTLRMLPSGQG